jgi:hypothetical protein
VEGSLESMSHSSASKRFFSSRTLPPARILYWHDDAKNRINLAFAIRRLVYKMGLFFWLSYSRGMVEDSPQ